MRSVLKGKAFHYAMVMMIVMKEMEKEREEI